MPHAHPSPDDTPRGFELGHIDDLTAAGRTNWFALVGYLGFALVTTLGVEDIDFFVDSRRTTLPLIGVSIPTFSFFVFAPVVGAALYAYLHHHIRKVSEALLAPPPVIEGMTLEERIQPWLLNDFILRRRNDGAIRRRPLDTAAGWTTILLVWWAGPIVLALMWWRTWPAHTLWLSAISAACLMAAAYSGWLSWAKLNYDMRRMKGEIDSDGFEDQAYRARTVMVALFCLPVAWLTLANSKGHLELPLSAFGASGAADPMSRPPPWSRAWNDVLSLGRLDVPNLAGAGLSTLPPEHVDLAAARHRYRTEFCSRLGIGAEICDRTPSPDYSPPAHIRLRREAWCHERQREPSSCARLFSRIDEEFVDEWSTYRSAIIAAVEKPVLRGNDLRTGNLAAAELAGLHLDNALLQEANLASARLERARLRKARLRGADLNDAWLENADLDSADLEGANLTQARLRDARLRDATLTGAMLAAADLKGADLRLARLRDANLWQAGLEGADLRKAELHEADLSNARLVGADLQEAVLADARLPGARLEAANLRDASFEGATLDFSNLTGATLSSTDLTGATLAGAALRHLDLRAAILGPEPDLRNAFGDTTTRLPSGVAPPCQWPSEAVSEGEFYARWRGWLELAPDPSIYWSLMVPEAWGEVEPVPPPQGCDWHG